MKSIKCKLNCEPQTIAALHMRPGGFIRRLCEMFPQTEFRLFRVSEGQRSPKKGVNPKSLIALASQMFGHGEEFILEVEGKCEVMAAEFFKVAWENLEEYSDDIEASKKRLAGLIDEAFSRIEDPDIKDFGGTFSITPDEERATADQESRSVAIINDRLHYWSLPAIPLIAKYFQSRLQIAFEVPNQGIFSFTMGPECQFALDSSSLERILDLRIEVGTKITILTEGPNRLRANAAVKNVLQNLWQCDAWLRNRGEDCYKEESIVELLKYAEQVGASQSPEYGYIQNPYISNILTNEHVLINSEGSEFSKEEVLSQLAAPHAQIHRLDFPVLLDRVRESERKEPVVLRDGFAIAHGAMDRTPRISISFGVYPKGVAWDGSGRLVRLVSMIVFAKDTYGTWRDYLRKMAIVFRSYPTLQGQLISAKGAGEFRNVLRQTETRMIK